MRKLFSFLIIFIFSLSLIFPSPTSAAYLFQNGMPAQDLLGQYDQTSFTDPVPVYTKSGANDGPNRFGLQPGGNAQQAVIDTVNHRFF